MQKAKLVDNATAGLKFQDSSTASALDGTILRAIFQNDNFDNLFTLVENAGYDLIDDDLEQIVKAVRGGYNATFTYNTSGIATQSVNDIVLGSDGIYYEVQEDGVSGDNPVGSVTGDWLPYLPYKSGTKNLLINGRKLIQQRGVSGGKIQVVLNTANLGGNHTLSWTGSATATIKEATTLGASDGATSWDTALAIAVTSGTTVTLTANKYVHVEFSTTSFDFAMLETGSVATNYEQPNNEAIVCGFYYEKRVDHAAARYASGAGAKIFGADIFASKKRVAPIMTPSGISYGNASTLNLAVIGTLGFRTVATASGTGEVQVIYTYEANAEIFNADDGVGINYKEDRWYV